MEKKWRRPSLNIVCIDLHIDVRIGELYSQ